MPWYITKGLHRLSTHTHIRLVCEFLCTIICAWQSRNLNVESANAFSHQRNLKSVDGIVLVAAAPSIFFECDNSSFILWLCLLWTIVLSAQCWHFVAVKRCRNADADTAVTITIYTWMKRYFWHESLRLFPHFHFWLISFFFWIIYHKQKKFYYVWKHKHSESKQTFILLFFSVISMWTPYRVCSVCLCCWC